MKRKRYSEEQIAFALRQAESGTPVEEICRKLGVPEPTFYRWKKQFAGMGVAEILQLSFVAAMDSRRSLAAAGARCVRRDRMGADQHPVAFNRHRVDYEPSRRHCVA
jgi:transposase-like protein